MWTKTEDNLFSANHRKKMLREHGITMAQVYTVDDFLKTYERKTLAQRIEEATNE